MSAACRTKLTTTTSAIAHPGDVLAHRDVPDAHTPRAADLAAETTIAAVIAARGRPTVVRRVQEGISLTELLAEDRRVPWKTRTI